MPCALKEQITRVDAEDGAEYEFVIILPMGIPAIVIITESMFNCLSESTLPCSSAIMLLAPQDPDTMYAHTMAMCYAHTP